VQQFKDAEAAEKLLKKKAAQSRKGAKPQTSSNPLSGRDGSSGVLNPLPENLHSALDGPDRLFVCGPSAEETVCLVGSSLAAERERTTGGVRGCDEDFLSDEELERVPSWSDRSGRTPASDPWCEGADRFSGGEKSEDFVAGKQRGRTGQLWTSERDCVTQETEKPGQHVVPSRLTTGGPAHQTWDGTGNGQGLGSSLRWGDKGGGLSGAVVINLDSDSDDDDVGKTAQEVRASTALFVQAGTEGHQRDRCCVRGARAKGRSQQEAEIASRLTFPLGAASRSEQRVSSQKHRQTLLHDSGMRREPPGGLCLSARQSAVRLTASCSSPDSSPPSSPKLVVPERSIRSILASINLAQPRPAPTLSLCA
jgi:hypothetical protein